MSRTFYLFPQLKPEEISSKTNLKLNKEANTIEDEFENGGICTFCPYGNLAEISFNISSDFRLIIATLIEIFNIEVMDEEDMEDYWRFGNGNEEIFNESLKKSTRKILESIL